MVYGQGVTYLSQAYNTDPRITSSGLQCQLDFFLTIFLQGMQLSTREVRNIQLKGVSRAQGDGWVDKAFVVQTWEPRHGLVQVM